MWPAAGNTRGRCWSRWECCRPRGALHSKVLHPVLMPPLEWLLAMATLIPQTLVRAPPLQLTAPHSTAPSHRQGTPRGTLLAVAQHPRHLTHNLGCTSSDGLIDAAPGVCPPSSRCFLSPMCIAVDVASRAWRATRGVTAGENVSLETELWPSNCDPLHGVSIDPVEQGQEWVLLLLSSSPSSSFFSWDLLDPRGRESVVERPRGFRQLAVVVVYVSSGFAWTSSPPLDSPPPTPPAPPLLTFRRVHVYPTPP